MRRNEEESSPRREAGVGVAWRPGGGPASGVRRRLASGAPWRGWRRAVESTGD